jgi:hypothetical protein
MQCFQISKWHAERLCLEKRNVSAPGADRQQNIIDAKSKRVQ